ncbi:hypothetical protein V8E53_012802 [Lactarius tabidus]
MVAGVTRVTANRCPIARPPIMISSKWIVDALGPDGIHASWIALRRYLWLTPFAFQDNGEIASDVMTPADKLVVLHEGILRSASLSARWAPGSITASPSCETEYC